MSIFKISNGYIGMLLNKLFEKISKYSSFKVIYLLNIFLRYFVTTANRIKKMRIGP